MEVVHTAVVVVSCGKCASEITNITCIPTGIGKYRIVVDPCDKCIENVKNSMLISTMLKKTSEDADNG